MGAGALADGGAVAVEGALAEAEEALAALQLVDGEAQLGVLDAHVGAALGHLVEVHVVVGLEGRVGGEEAVDLARHGGAAAVGAVQRPGEHGHGPLAQAHGVLGVAVAVEEGQEARRHVPVEAQVHVLQRVHGRVLQRGQVDDGGEEMQADEVGPQAAALVRRHCQDGVVEEQREPPPLVEPEHKDLEHVGRLGREPQDRVLLLVVVPLPLAAPRRGRGRDRFDIGLEEGAAVAEQLPVQRELALLLPDQHPHHVASLEAVAESD